MQDERSLEGEPALGLSKPARMGSITLFPSPAERGAAPASGWEQPPGQRHNLPAQPTRLIGREREVELARERLLDDTVRLLTIIGPGGMGKTRLAVEVAGSLLDSFEDGVFFVDLAPIVDEARVPNAIAHALGIRETLDQSLCETITLALRDRRMLLLLDNFEQVAGAAPRIGETLASCPELKLLATSRTPLHLRWEHELQLPPLAVPIPPRSAAEMPSGSSASRDPVTAGDAPAVDLFVERARSVRPGFQLDDEGCQIVAEICRRLDGLPLAIELAAARCRILSPKAILARLVGEDAGTGHPSGNQLQLLTGGSHDLPRRHQTLRETIGWSYGLLSKQEQALFRRLGPFVGGFTLEAAEDVASQAFSDSRLDVTDTLESLVSQSLVRVDETDGGEPRFRLLETIREYALERLTEHGETEAVRARHADCFVALVEQAAPKLQGEDQADWLNRLEREHANLRATFRWCLDRGQGERALQLATALWRYWYIRGHFVEGRRLFSTLLTLPACADRTKARAEALNAAGNLAYNQADYPAARAYHEEALGIRRELDDQRSVAGSLNNLALPLRCQGDYAEATALLDEAVRINRAVGNRLWEAICLSNLGVVMDDLGDPSRSQALQGESRTIFAELGDEWGVAMALRHLADVSRHHGDRLEARALYEEGIRLARNVGDRRGLAQALVGLGGTACDLEDYPTARHTLEEGLAISRALDDRFTVARALEGFAILAAARGEHERAVRLVSTSAALRQSIDAPLSPVKQATLKRWTEPAETKLSPDRLATLESEGWTMSLDQAVAYALEVAGCESRVTIDAPPTRAPRVATRASERLTRREHEVALLVARGLTNRQIADDLIIGERTVDTHVRNILGKLEFDTRAQIAAWIARA